MDNLKEFEDLWTSNKDTTFLVKSDLVGGYSIIQLENNQPMFVLIDDNELHNQVVDRMINENYTITTIDELKKLCYTSE